VLVNPHGAEEVEDVLGSVDYLQLTARFLQRVVHGDQQADTGRIDHLRAALVQIVWFKQEQSDLFLSKGPIDGLFTQLLRYESKRKLLFAPEPTELLTEPNAALC